MTQHPGKQGKAIATPPEAYHAVVDFGKQKRCPRMASIHLQLGAEPFTLSTWQSLPTTEKGTGRGQSLQVSTEDKEPRQGCHLIKNNLSTQCLDLIG